MKRAAVGLVCVFVAIAAVAAGRAETAGRFEYRQVTLENGLRVITMEDFSCPVVAVHLWYHVGSKDEHPQRQGFAHMFEHMMFRGTDRLGPTDHFDYIRRTGGNCNAYTAMDQTVYVQTAPANQLELILWLESERMAFLKIDQEAFDTERKVVEEERRLGLNRPYGALLEKILGALFEKHPYRWSTIGQISHLRAASVQELRDFWTRYYVPNNATLVIVGAVRHEDAQQAAKRAFGWIPRYPDPPRVNIEEPLPGAPRDVVIQENNAPAPLVGLIFRTVPARHDDRVALELLANILGGGQSSRIYRELVAERQLAVFAMAGSFTLEQDGLLGLGAVLAPVGGDPDAVLEALQAQVERIRSEPVGPEELEKARNMMLKQLVEQNLTVESKASAIGSAAVLEGDAERVNFALARLPKITADELLRVARTYLVPERMYRGRVERNLLGAIGSWLGFRKGEEDAPITAAPETDPPPPGRAGLTRPDSRPVVPPSAGPLAYDASLKYESARLENGLEVLVVENHELPYLSVRLGLRGGAWCEEKPGAASLAMEMLTRGTENYSEAELARELDTYAITLTAEADMDSSAVYAGLLSEHADRALRLMAEVVQRPTFPEGEFEKLRRQTLTSLAISSKEPSYLADRELRRRLFGRHPYARTTSAEYADVEALDVQALKRWWRAFVRPEEASLIFSGDIDRAGAIELARRYFGDWRAAEPRPAVELAAIPAAAPTRIYLVDYPGVQSQIRVGQIGITREHPAYFTSLVVSNYFGGAFSARLNETIRVQKGLTYGARGGWSAQRLAGQFVVSTFSKTESTAEAVRAIFDELARLREQPPSEKELADACSYLIGSFPGGRETPQAVASDLWLVRSHGLGDDYFRRMLERIAGTTAQECTQMVAQTLDPSKLVVVVVGPAEQLREPLAQICPVTVVAADEGGGKVADQ